MVGHKKKFDIAFIFALAFFLNSLVVMAAPPVLDLIGGKQIDEGQLLEFTITASDSDNDTLIFGKNDSRGSLSQDAGQYSWTPSFNEAGIYFVRFTVSGGAESASEIIMVNVTEVGNHAPILDLIGGKQILEGQLLEFSVSASDPDGDELAFSTNSSSGVLDSTGKFSWQADFDDSGIYFVLFSVSDMNEAVSEIIMVNVTEAGNHAPLISIIEPAGLPVSGNVSVSWAASDIDNDDLEFSAFVAGRIYDNGILIGENRTKVCMTALSNCVFDSALFANGNYAVIVAANDSADFAEAYSNDFEISNLQPVETSAQSETRQANANEGSNAPAPTASAGSSGGNGPPPFWWLSMESQESQDATSQAGLESDVQEQQQSIASGAQDSANKNEGAQAAELLPKQPETDVMPSSSIKSESKFYMFAWLTLLVLIVPVAYIPYKTLSRDKMRSLQDYAKKKMSGISIKASRLHKEAIKLYAKRLQ